MAAKNALQWKLASARWTRWDPVYPTAAPYRRMPSNTPRSSRRIPRFMPLPEPRPSGGEPPHAKVPTPKARGGSCGAEPSVSADSCSGLSYTEDECNGGYVLGRTERGVRAMPADCDAGWRDRQ